jgi:hypothetical protein
MISEHSSKCATKWKTIILKISILHDYKQNQQTIIN